MNVCCVFREILCGSFVRKQQLVVQPVKAAAAAAGLRPRPIGIVRISTFPPSQRQRDSGCSRTTQRRSCKRSLFAIINRTYIPVAVSQNLTVLSSRDFGKWIPWYTKETYTRCHPVWLSTSASNAHRCMLPSTSVYHNSSSFHTSCSARTSAAVKADPKEYLEATDQETYAILKHDMLVYKNFISKEEENSLFEEVEPYLKRLRYEASHWDDAIHGYRETERKNWREANRSVLNRVRQLAFPPGVAQLAYMHVLDLSKSGVIKAHIDSVRFCGTTIAGLSLLSPAVMRLVCDADKSKFADVLLQPRSLYIMRNRARYEYTHEVLGEADSKFRGEKVPRDRRISIICRNEPAEEIT